MSAEFSSQQTMADLLRQLPGAQRALFRLYHIGGCASCSFHPDETLAEVCARNGNLNPIEVLEQIQVTIQQDEKMFISPQELAEALKGQDVRVLDIRTREEFEAVPFPQAQFFNQDLLQQAMASWSKEKLLVLVDHQGLRSLDAAAYFAGHGFIHVKALYGGIDAWSKEIDSSLPQYTLE